MWVCVDVCAVSIMGGSVGVCKGVCVCRWVCVCVDGWPG